MILSRERERFIRVFEYRITQSIRVYTHLEQNLVSKNWHSALTGLVYPFSLPIFSLLCAYRCSSTLSPYAHVKFPLSLSLSLKAISIKDCHMHTCYS